MCGLCGKDNKKLHLISDLIFQARFVYDLPKLIKNRIDCILIIYIFENT